MTTDIATHPSIIKKNDTIVSINPADGSIAGTVRRSTIADVDKAVIQAWTAFRSQPWRHLRLDQRANTLYEIGRRLLLERETLARLQMLDSGKPWKECLNMVDSAAGSFRYYAAVCETHQGEVTPARGEYFSLAIGEPFGVIAAITPWWSMSTILTARRQLSWPVEAGKEFACLRC